MTSQRSSAKLRPRFALAALIACASASVPALADDAVCQLDPQSAPDKPAYVEAVVLGPASEADVLAQTRIAIERTRAPVSPAYVKLPRIDAIFRDSAGRAHRTIAAVIDGPPPPPGAHVTLATRYRDPNEPCAFIPWTVSLKGAAT